MIVDWPDISKEDTEKITMGRVRPSFTMFLNNMTMAPNDYNCLEIGTSTGVNALTMLKVDFINLTVVDPYLDNQHEETIMRNRLKPYADRVTIIKDTSNNAVDLFKDHEFDYIYIDGRHDYQGVMEDLENWFPKLKPTGLFAGHDFNLEGVFTAVNDFMIKKDKKVYGVVQLGSQKVPRCWNLEQCCDWWAWA